jgi:hypothetical protein
VSRGLSDLIADLLSPDPDRRPPSAATVVTALQSLAVRTDAREG